MIKKIKQYIGNLIRLPAYKFIYGQLHSPKKFFHCGKKTYISPDCDIDNPELIDIGERCRIEKLVWLAAVDKEKKAQNPKIIIGNRTYVGRMSVIAATNHIEIKDSVLIGPRVHITDNNHKFDDVTKPIIDQGWDTPGKIIIEKGAWIGVNSVIIASKGKTLTIGQNSVIGANSIVTESVPDFSVAVGMPAKVIRKIK